MTNGSRLRWVLLGWCALAVSLVPAVPAATAADEEQMKPAGGSGLTAPIDSRASTSITLREAMETALRNNLGVAISSKDVAIAREDVEVEESAFDPLFGAEAIYGRDKSEPLSDFSSTGSQFWRGSASLSQVLKQGFTYAATWTSSKDRSLYVPEAFQLPFFDPASPTYLSGLQLQLTQPLLRGMGSEANTAGIEIARLGVESSDEAFRATLIDTLGQVQTAYWDLASAIANLKVQRESLKLANDLLSLNRKKVEVGTLAPIQITEAEASVASREQSVILAEAEIKNAEDNLRQVLNIAPELPSWDMALVPTDRPSMDDVPLDEDELVSAALDKRPELRQARNQVKVADLSHRYAQNARKPQLDAFAEYMPRGNNYESGRVDALDTDGDGTDDSFLLNLGDLAESAGEVFDNDIYSWDVGVRYSIPIGNRAGKALEARSRVTLEQWQLSTESLARSIRAEVRKAILAVSTFRKSVEAARVNVRLQRQKLDAEQKRYDNGMSTSFQVLTFQNDLTAALSQEITALTAYTKSLVALGRVTATLPERSGVTLVSADQIGGQ